MAISVKSVISVIDVKRRGELLDDSRGARRELLVCATALDIGVVDVAKLRAVDWLVVLIAHSESTDPECLDCQACRLRQALDLTLQVVHLAANRALTKLPCLIGGKFATASGATGQLADGTRGGTNLRDLREEHAGRNALIGGGGEHVGIDVGEQSDVLRHVRGEIVAGFVRDELRIRQREHAVNLLDFLLSCHCRYPLSAHAGSPSRA